MTKYKMSEKRPEKDQYAFIKNGDDWLFAMYQGTEESPDVWGFFRNPESFALGAIEEWQPALVRIKNPSVDVLSKKVIYDLDDITNDEGVSFYKEFVNSVGENNGNSASGTDDNLEKRGVDIQAEVLGVRNIID